MNAPPISKGGAVAIVLVFLLLGLAVQTWRNISLERENVQLRLLPQKQAAVVTHYKTDTVTVQLAAAEKVVTRVLTQVRTDTLVLRPQTAQDTATALVQFPALAAAHDSLQRSCSAFVVSCADYRSAAEKRFTADSVYARSLEAALKRQQPGRLAAIWNRIKTPIYYGAGVCTGLVLAGKPCIP